MKQKYRRLKLKLLAQVVLVTFGVLLLGALAMRVLVDGVWEEPFAQAFLWVAEGLFGHEEADALALYDQYVRQWKELYVTGAVVIILLIAFYAAMGRFTRWLNQISAEVHRLVDDGEGSVKLPRELAPLERDLTGLQETLRARKRQAAEEEQRKNDLLVFLAHDLKTPLTSVIGYLNLLRDDPDLTPEQRSKFTGIALDKALRLEDLMLEFFEITRESLHGAPTPRENIQLSFLLEQLADEFMPQLAQKRLTCRSEIQPRLEVEGDPDKLARVFDNVLRNAVNYSSEGGEVEITALKREKNVVITIRNEGLTIPEQELANIFRKFYRLDSARSSRTGGAGLGLAIAKEIVEAHGGTIHAESDGQKTAFVIELPCAEKIKDMR